MSDLIKCRVGFLGSKKRHKHFVVAKLNLLFSHVDLSDPHKLPGHMSISEVGNFQISFAKKLQINVLQLKMFASTISSSPSRQ